MNQETKTLIPKKEWIVKFSNIKIGSITKDKTGVSFLRRGKKIQFHNILELESKFGIKFPTDLDIKESNITNENNVIYDYPCSSVPYEPIFNIKKKLPLFYKSAKSKSQYCAGYYIIKFQKRWVRSFCPKLITLERYPFQGPYKTEAEIKKLLGVMNKS